MKYKHEHPNKITQNYKHSLKIIHKKITQWWIQSHCSQTCKEEVGGKCQTTKRSNNKGSQITT